MGRQYPKDGLLFPEVLELSTPILLTWRSAKDTNDSESSINLFNWQGHLAATLDLYIIAYSLNRTNSAFPFQAFFRIYVTLDIFKF